MSKEDEIEYSVEFELSDQIIDHVSRKQRFVYRCLTMFGPQEEHTYSISRKKELMQHWIKKLFPPDCGIEAAFIFDETMWQPADETAHGNRVKLVTTSQQYSTYLVSEIDFRTSDHHIFNTKYKWRK
jgi:hypothetical protein